MVKISVYYCIFVWKFMANSVKTISNFLISNKVNISTSSASWVSENNNRKPLDHPTAHFTRALKNRKYLFSWKKLENWLHMPKTCDNSPNTLRQFSLLVYLSHKRYERKLVGTYMNFTVSKCLIGSNWIICLFWWPLLY